MGLLAEALRNNRGTNTQPSGQDPAFQNAWNQFQTNFQNSGHMGVSDPGLSTHQTALQQMWSNPEYRNIVQGGGLSYGGVSTVAGSGGGHSSGTYVDDTPLQRGDTAPIGNARFNLGGELYEWKGGALQKVDRSGGGIAGAVGGFLTDPATLLIGGTLGAGLLAGGGAGGAGVGSSVNPGTQLALAEGTYGTGLGAGTGTTMGSAASLAAAEAAAGLNPSATGLAVGPAATSMGGDIASLAAAEAAAGVNPSATGLAVGPAGGGLVHGIGDVFNEGGQFLTEGGGAAILGDLLSGAAGGYLEHRGMSDARDAYEAGIERLDPYNKMPNDDPYIKAAMQQIADETEARASARGTLNTGRTTQEIYDNALARLYLPARGQAQNAAMGQAQLGVGAGQASGQWWNNRGQDAQTIIGNMFTDPNADMNRLQTILQLLG